MAWVYILQTKSGRYYVGSTSDLKRRLEQHVVGHTHSTARLHPTSVLLKQEYETLKEARSVELKIKKLKRKDYIEQMIKEGYIKIRPQEGA